MYVTIRDLTLEFQIDIFNSWCDISLGKQKIQAQCYKSVTVSLISTFNSSIILPVSDMNIHSFAQEQYPTSD